MFRSTIRGLQWVPFKNSQNLFLEWRTFINGGDRGNVWVLAFYAIYWSIWKFRNDMIFNEKIWDANQLFDLIKLRVAVWAKSKWPHVMNSAEYLICCPENISNI